MSKEDYFIKDVRNEKQVFVDFTGYQISKMGGYINNRLFCNFEKIFAQFMPSCDTDRFSVSGMRADKSGICSFTSGFCAGVGNSSFYFSDYYSGSGILHRTLYFLPKQYEDIEMDGDHNYDSNDCVLYRAYDFLFSGC